MPLYFFNIQNHVTDVDQEGTELEGPEAARVEAIRFAGDCLRDDPGLIKDGQNFYIDVCDTAGVTLLRIAVTATDPTITRSSA